MHGLTLGNEFEAVNSGKIKYMTETSADPLICVAAIAGAFGVKGEVKLKSFTEAPENCVGYGPLLNKDGKVILTPKNNRVMKNFIAVTAPEISTPEEADALKSVQLFVPRDRLPEAEEDDFYYSDLVGLDVKSDSGKRIGQVVGVHEFGAGDMLEIAPHPDKKTKKTAPSFFHPFTKAATPKVDIAAGRLIIVPQEAE